MSKTIKIIDLLNKIANGEETANNVKYDGDEWKWNNKIQDFENNEGDFLFDLVKYNTTQEFMNAELEIIEEQEEIDIQSIEEIEPSMNGNACIIDNKTWTLNQVIKAVKQLDKNIKEK
jgi:MinD superfamily P-loop ATPase